jgi:tellurite resistance-related uncharacterized protein
MSNIPRLPETVVSYSRTATFDETTVPKGLLAQHQTKANVWGRIVVEAGKLLYALEGQGQDASWELVPGVDGIIPPELLHRVAPLGPVRFHVEFLREPTDA